MKATTQSLFSYILTHQWKAIETLPIDTSDRTAMNLIYVLADHHLVTHPLIGANNVKTYLQKEVKSFYEKSQWKQDPDLILFVLLLRLGDQPFASVSGYPFHRFKFYFPNAFTDIHLTQPKILELLDGVPDNKSAFPFLDLLKGIWCVALKDYPRAKHYLKNVSDIHRKTIALYFQAKVDLALGNQDDLKEKLKLLKEKQLIFPDGYLTNFLKEAETAIDQFHHLDFFNDIKQKQNYPVDKIEAYIEKVFDSNLWKKVDPKTKTMVKTAFYLSSRMASLLEEGLIQDYSAFALPFVKAYEHECYKLFFKDFIQYLIKEGISPKASIPPHFRNRSYSTIVDMDQEPFQYQSTEPENFSIGNITYIIGISRKLAKKEIQQIDPSGLSVAPMFEAYWKKRTQSLSLNGQGKGKLIEIVKLAASITSLRNKMTHAEMLTLDEFKQIVALILENHHLKELMQINLPS